LGYNYVYIENGVIFKNLPNNKNVTVRGMTSSIARSKRKLEGNVTALSNLSSREHLSSRYG